MKPNFFVRALFALFLFTIIGLGVFAIALDAGLLPTSVTTSAASNPALSRQLSPHQIAANSYQQALEQLRSNRPVQPQPNGRIIEQQVVEQIEEQISEGQTLQALETDRQQRSSFGRAMPSPDSSELPPASSAEIVTRQLNASLPEVKPSPFDIIDAALQPGRTYPISLKPPAFTPPSFAQQLPQTLGKMGDRVKEQPIRIIETSQRIRPAMQQQIESASERIQQIPEKLKDKLRDKLSDTLDQMGEKAHKTAEELRDL